MDTERDLEQWDCSHGCEPCNPRGGFTVSTKSVKINEVALLYG